MHDNPRPPPPETRPVIPRAAALSRFRFFALMNPLGANLTIGSTTSLLALHYGANNLQMGLLYGAIYIAGFTALFSPLAFQGRDVTRVGATTWWVRSIWTAGLFALPFLPSSMQAWALVVILLVFFMFRSLGNAALPVIIKALASPRDLGRVNNENFFRWNLGCLITSLLAWGVLSQKTRIGEETAFMLLYGVAVTFNLVSAWALGRLPSVGQPEPVRERALWEGLRLVARERVYREVVILTLLMVPLSVAASYQVNALKTTLGFDADVITALSVAGLLSALLGSRALLVIGSRIATRSLMVGSHVILLSLSLAWVFLGLLPAAMQPVVGAGLFIASAMFLSITAILLATMANHALPATGAISVSSVYSLAGVVGALSGIGVITFLGGIWPSGHWGMHGYSHAFAVSALLSIGVCLWAFRMVGGRISAFTGDIGQFRPDNLLAVFRFRRIRIHSSSKPHEVRELENALVSRVPAQVPLIRESLSSPEFRERSAAFRALLQSPHPEHFDAVRDEARNPHSPFRVEAVTVLGLMGQSEGTRGVDGHRHGGRDKAIVQSEGSRGVDGHRHGGRDKAIVQSEGTRGTERLRQGGRNRAFDQSEGTRGADGPRHGGRNQAIAKSEGTRGTGSNCLAVLRQLKRDPDTAVMAAAWKGLLRMGEPFSEREILSDYGRLASGISRVDMLTGLLARRETTLLWKALAHDLGRGADPTWQRSVLLIIGESLGDSQLLRDRFDAEREDPREAWNQLVADLPETFHGLTREDWEKVLASDGRVHWPKGISLPPGIRKVSPTLALAVLHLEYFRDHHGSP